MDPITLLGIVGAIIILALFLLNQFKIVDVDNIWYDLGNVIGGTILVVYALLIDSLPFLLINGVWVLFSLRDVVIDLMRK